MNDAVDVAAPNRAAAGKPRGVAGRIPPPKTPRVRPSRAWLLFAALALALGAWYGFAWLTYPSDRTP